MEMLKNDLKLVEVSLWSMLRIGFNIIVLLRFPHGAGFPACSGHFSNLFWFTTIT